MRINAATLERFQQGILAYWVRHGRHDLPWRKVRDPWTLLLVETTLRKTTSKQALAAYASIAKLTPKDLISAELSDLEELLRPMGLQRIRAENLIRIARMVTEAGRDALESEQFLRSLPGVGKYIVNAVRCNSFNVPVPTLDTNMIRIITRVFGYESIRARPREDIALWEFASSLVPPRQPREFNWGVLDFAAQVCTAKSPKCETCPLQTICSYYQSTSHEVATSQPSVSPNPNAQTAIDPSVVSLFSGAGGFDWGFHRAGYKNLLCFELMPAAAQTLGVNLGLTITTPDGIGSGPESCVIQGDIQTVDFAKISLAPDVLIGGPPCQDFSVSKAQERQGLNGGRGHLYREFVRAVMYFQPKLFVFENVPGLTSANRGQAFHTILNDLRHLEDKRRECLAVAAPYTVPASPVQNYVILFRNIVDAVRLGVPQIRRRLILVGVREDLYLEMTPNRRAVVINGMEQKMNGSEALFSRYPLTSLETFEGKPLTELQSEYREIMQQYADIDRAGKSQRAVQWKREVLAGLTLDAVEDYLTLNQLNGTSNFGLAQFEKSMQEHEQLLGHLNWLNKPVSSLESTDGTNLPIKQSKAVIDRMYNIPPDENAGFVDGTDWEVESKDISFIYRRTSPLKPAMTVMAYGGGGTHGYHYRRTRSALTLRERARIQTFTDDFMFCGNHIRAQIGEAVPPLLGEHIGMALQDILTFLD